MAAEQQCSPAGKMKNQMTSSLYPCPSLEHRFPFNSMLEKPVSDLQPKIRLQELVPALQAVLSAAATERGLKNICCLLPQESCSACHQGALPRAELLEKAESDGLGGEQERRDVWLEMAGWVTGALQREHKGYLRPLRAFTQISSKTYKAAW